MSAQRSRVTSLPSRLTLLILCVLAVLSLGGGCGPKGSDNTTGTVLRENAHLIEGKTADEAVVGQSSLTFPLAGNEALLERQPGDILIGRRQSTKTGANPYGFLRRILAISSDGSQIKIDTQRATLEDAFASADLVVNTLGTGTTVHATSIHSPYLRVRDAGANAAAGHYELNRDFVGTWEDGSLGFGESTDPAEKTVKLHIEGELDLAPTFDIYARLRGLGLEEAHILLGGDFHAQLAASVTLEGPLGTPLKQHWPLWEAEKIILIPDPPIEITAKVEIGITCQETVVGSLTAEIGADMDITGMNLGLVYEAGHWKKVNDGVSAFHRIGPQISGTVTAKAKCWLEPKVSFLVYDAIGPFVEINPYVRAERQLVPECDLKAFAGIDGVIGFQAQIPIFRVVLTDVHYTYNFAEKQIYGAPPGDCGGTLDGGGPPILFSYAARQNHPAHVAVDDTNIYWTNEGSAPGYADGVVLRERIDGSEAPVVLSTSQEHPTSIAADDTWVYWTDHGSCSVPTAYGQVLRQRKDGSAAPVVIATLQDEPTAIAVDDSFVYWTNAAPVAGSIMRANKDGSSPVVLAHGRAAPMAMALDEGSVYWTEFGSGDDEWLDGEGGDGRVGRVAKDGSGLTILAEGEIAPLGIAVDDSNVYWVSAGGPSGGTVRVAPKGSENAPPTTLFTGQGYPYGIQVDDRYVYWTTHTSIMRAPKTEGAEAERLATDPHSPLSLALYPPPVDGKPTDRVVWADEGTPTADGHDLPDGDIVGVAVPGADKTPLDCKIDPGDVLTVYAPVDSLKPPAGTTAITCSLAGLREAGLRLKGQLFGSGGPNHTQMATTGGAWTDVSIIEAAEGGVAERSLSGEVKTPIIGSVTAGFVYNHVNVLPAQVCVAQGHLAGITGVYSAPDSFKVKPVDAVASARARIGTTYGLVPVDGVTWSYSGSITACPKFGMSPGWGGYGVYCSELAWLSYGGMDSTTACGTPGDPCFDPKCLNLKVGEAAGGKPEAPNLYDADSKPPLFKGTLLSYGTDRIPKDFHLKCVPEGRMVLKDGTLNPHYLRQYTPAPPPP